MLQVPTGKGTQYQETVQQRSIGDSVTVLVRENQLVKGSVVTIILNNFFKI